MKNSFELDPDGKIPMGVMISRTKDLLDELVGPPNEFEAGVVTSIVRILGLSDGWIEDMGVLLGLDPQWESEMQEREEQNVSRGRGIFDLNTENANDREPMIIRSGEDWYFKDDAHLMVITTDRHQERKGYGPMATGEFRIFLATPPTGEEVILVYPWAGTFADTFDDEAAEEAKAAERKAIEESLDEEVGSEKDKMMMSK